MNNMTSSRLIIFFALFLMAFGNIAFFSNIIEAYPVDDNNSLFLLSIAIVFTCAIVILFSLVCNRYTIKPVLILTLLISSCASYFMNSYNIVIDDIMIDNILSTDRNESADLFNMNIILYLFFLGILPSIYIYKVNILYTTFIRESTTRLKLISVSIVLALALIVIFGNFYASFFREHKKLRFYANPTFYIYSAIKYSGRYIKNDVVKPKPIGLDAVIPASGKRRKLFVLVVGETVRSDHLSLNGYQKETNPYLKHEDVTSFTNFWSCGTSTGVSVPCMFSIYDRSNFSNTKENHVENVLDVLQRVGVNVIWLDNNTGSKGVASRVAFESYRASDVNPVCDIECRDEGMISRLPDYINTHPQGDIFIIMHQMGNHGPAYYKRYPEQFETFKPTCKTNQLENCSEQEINNAYDNALLYTDYFLSRVIGALKAYNNEFDTGMIYVSDHGESLGEKGLYLHGLPYIFAPEEQKKVPMITWLSSDNDQSAIKSKFLKEKINEHYSHDNIFHTILGLFDVETSIYKSKMNILSNE